MNVLPAGGRVAVLLAIFSAGCTPRSTSNPPAAESTVASAPASSTPPVADSAGGASAGWAVRLEREACHGTCPIYTVEIQGNGTVSFNGLQHVRAMGAQTGTIPAGRVQQLREQLQRANFTALPGTYEHGSPGCEPYATDLPTVTITVRDGAQSHAVRHDHGCHGAPAVLNTLEQAIDSAANVSQWTKGKEPKGRTAR